MVNYPPYIVCYGKIGELFQKISQAAVPHKFTLDFLYTKLGFKTTTHRKFIPFLKKIGFLDDAQVPTQIYKDFRDSSKSGRVMAKVVRNSYKDLFEAHEYAYELKKSEIENKLNSMLGASKDDKTMIVVVATLWELLKLSNFEESETVTDEGDKINGDDLNSDVKNSEDILNKTVVQKQNQLGLTYTINLNLPATDDVEVFNAIFKSLKENLLK